MIRRILGAGSVAALAVTALGVAPTAHAAPAGQPADPTQANRVDDHGSPLSDKQRRLTRAAVDAVVKGTAKVEKNTKGDHVVRLGNRKYVNFDVDREESIFTVLAQFGDKTLPAAGGAPGPLHNQIPQPDRTVNNSTIWAPDFNTAHYSNMMFGKTNSFKDYYLKQSNGRFLAKGDVSDWVTVPYNEARYGHNPADGDGTSEAEGSWSFIADTAQAWYDAQKAAGKSDADIKAYLAQFDKVDRYDYDGDGDFNEPDGYIDHFQAIHAGEGEEAGGGAQGEDAIWSHRWYAKSDDTGKTGPGNNLAGGVPIGDTGLWIGDYTTEPENGGLGVFAHEFGHDLGLPDLYDTKGGANTTGYWTLMSSGSWLNDGTQDIGSEPGYMGPWEKLQLGWLDYRTVEYGRTAKLTLGPADRVSRRDPQAILVKTPDGTQTTQLGAPHSGGTQWWSGSRDKDKATMTRTIDLTGATAGSVSAWIRTDLEADYDYLYAEVSTDGTTWTQVGAPITGKTDWTQVTYDLAQFAGQKVTFRFRSYTDGGTHGLGSFIDDITVTAGDKVVTDDVENGDGGWAAKDFTRVGATNTVPVQSYYLAENRTYSGYDTFLKTGPYNFGFTGQKDDWVEHYPYQDGMLVWFHDGRYTDNNTSKHPGGGLILPVDARPQALRFASGAAASSRVQPFDATFGRQRTDKIVLHRNGTETLTVPSRPAIPVFDDSDPNGYYDVSMPSYSTKVAGSGTRIAVKKVSKDGTVLDVDVTFARDGK